MRLPRTIRLDGSDEQVFERAAAPDEWAVSGAFAFADTPPEALRGKTAQAFARGFLGTKSFGWSTLVAVAEIGPGELEAVIEALARHFVECYGAPSLAAARPAAEAEAAFAREPLRAQGQHADRGRAQLRSGRHRRALSHDRAAEARPPRPDLDDRRRRRGRRGAPGGSGA